jgi:hypothetical protein
LKTDDVQAIYPSKQAAGALYTMETLIKKTRILWLFSPFFGFFQRKKWKNHEKRRIYSPSDDLVYLPEHMKRDIGWLEESPRDCNKPNK